MKRRYLLFTIMMLSMLCTGLSTPASAGYADAYKYWFQPRAYPNADIDWEAWGIAADLRDQMQPATMNQGQFQSQQIMGALGLSGGWQFVGPRNMGVPYQRYFGIGHINGRVNAVAFDPQDPNTIWAGSAGGGVWKSTNKGANWLSMSEFGTPLWPFLQVSSIAIDPTRSNYVYVGTGDFDGGLPYGFGIMKTTDGGASWTNLGKAEFGGLAVKAITVDPNDQEIVMVATGRGKSYFGRIWRSTNGGTNWNMALDKSGVPLPFAMWSDVKYGQFDYTKVPFSRWYYAVGYSDTAGVQFWRSDDRGATWERYLAPVAAWGVPTLKVRPHIATSPQQPNTVYYLAGYDQSLWKSYNAGEHWTKLVFPSAGADLNEIFGQYDYDATIACSGFATGSEWSDQVYVGIRDLFLGTGGGLPVWGSIALAREPGSLIHCDQHALAISPFDSDVMLIGNDGGAYMQDTDGNLNSLNGGSPGLGITQFYKADFHPTDPTAMIGGTQDNASPYAWGDLYNWGCAGSGDGGWCAINQTDRDVQFATGQTSAAGIIPLHSTTDAWVSTTRYELNFGTDKVAWLMPMILDPNDSNVMYVGTNYLWRLDAADWHPRLGGQELAAQEPVPPPPAWAPEHYVTTIAVAPGHPERIYTGSDRGEVWMTTDTGTSWVSLHGGSGLGGGLPGRSITSISINPGNPDDILVGFSGTGAGHIWRCSYTRNTAPIWQDVSGKSFWGNVLPDVPLNAIARDPWDAAKNWYVATDVGVFMTYDGGVAWYNATAPLGLPNVQVNDLKAVPGQHYLYAATFGRGMWRISNTESVVVGVPVGVVEGEDPPSVGGGSKTKGIVIIPEIAPPGGMYADISVNNLAATVPQTVLIPEGAASAEFDVMTSAVSQDTPVTVTASCGGQIAKCTFVVAPATPSTIGGAKVLPPGGVVNVSGYVTAVFPDCFYVEAGDRSSGIRVTSLDPFPPLGQEVSVSGSLSTAGPNLTLVYATWSPIGQLPSILRPMCMPQRTLGGVQRGLQKSVRDGRDLSNIGLLVTTYGLVTYVDPSGAFGYINDGSDLDDGNTLGLDGSAILGVRVMGGSLPANGRLVVTGISVAEIVGTNIVRAIRQSP